MRVHYSSTRNCIFINSQVISKANPWGWLLNSSADICKFTLKATNKTYHNRKHTQGFVATD